MVPSTAASLLLSIPSLTNCSLCFFTSSLAISSLVIPASLAGLIMPKRKFDRNMGFLLSFRLKMRDRIWFLYFWLVCLYRLKISSSNMVARSSHLNNTTMTVHPKLMSTYLSISIPSGVLSPLIEFSSRSRQRLLTSSPDQQIWSLHNRYDLLT